MINQIKNICEKKRCTGCMACYNACREDAIILIEDDFLGNVYPKIQTDKCINCSKCKSICPELNQVQRSTNINCYAMLAKSNNLLLKTSSGGIASLLSEHIINEGGFVYGSAFAKDGTIRHIKIRNKKDIDKIAGSKYSHSFTNDTFNDIKQELVNEKIILFIGTPCQVAGLKSFLKEKYTNLYTIDLVCHGTPSQKLLNKQVNHDIGNINYDYIKFRTKKHKEQFRFDIYKNNNKIFDEKWNKNAYYYLFMKAASYRESCYSCQYANKSRIGDITLGDFWGLTKKSNLYQYKNKGVSVVMTNSPKGQLLIDKIKDKVLWEKRSLNEAISENPQLNHPSAKTKNAKEFRKIYSWTHNLELSYFFSYTLHYIKYLFIK